MSYFLSFWKQNETCRLTPKEIDSDLLADQQRQSLKGLIPLNNWAIAERFSERFPEIIHNKYSTSTDLIQSEWESQDGSRSFLIDWYPLHFSIQCCTATREDLNQAINIAIEFDCRLFDPQTGLCYDGLAGNVEPTES